MNWKNIEKKDNEIILKDEWIISISYKRDVDVIYTQKYIYVVKKNSKVRVNAYLVKFTLADKRGF